LTNKNILFFVFVLFIIVGYFVFQNSFSSISPKSYSKNPIKQIDIDKDDDIMSLDKMEKELKNFDEKVKSIDSELNIDKYKIDNKRHSSEYYTNIFNQLDKDSVKNISKKSDVEPIKAVSVDENSLVKINKGDVFELPLLGNSVYNVKVDQKVQNKNGSVTITGNLVENNNYSVIMTKGKERTFMTVSTPDGSYEVEIKNGEGYVYSVKDIEKKRIDYNKPDTLVPPNYDR